MLLQDLLESRDSRASLGAKRRWELAKGELVSATSVAKAQPRCGKSLGVFNYVRNSCQDKVC